MELFDALRARTSCRAYSSKVPGNKIQIDFLNYINNVPVLLPDADISIELMAYEDVLNYFPAYADKMIKAPLYLVFRGEMGLYQFMNIGYYAEHASIWLTSNGLASVWQSGFKLRNVYDDEFFDDIKLDQDYDADSYYQQSKSYNENPLLPAVLALGYPKNDDRPKPTRKKKLKNILLSDRSSLNNNTLSLIEAARTAPSEYNYQPWRFSVESDNLIHIFMKDSVIFRSKQRQNMRQVSMGCALGNMAIMAALRGIRLDYGFVENLHMPDLNHFQGKNLYYLGTLRLEKVYRQMMFGIDY